MASRKQPEVFGVPTRIAFNVKCPKCGKMHEEIVMLMMAGRPSAGKGSFYFFTSPFDSFCGGKDDFK